MINYRYCPQCRQPLTKDTEDNPYCAHCKLTIYNNVATCATVLPIKNGRVLLAVRGIEPFKGTIDVIGGFLKSGETLEAGALREAMEETGLKMKLGELLGGYPDTYGENGTPLIGTAFVAEITDTKAPQAQDDVASLEWFELTNLPFERCGFESAKAVLRDLQKWYQRKPLDN